MSQIIKILMIGLSCIGLSVLIGCGTPNDAATFNPDTQRHLEGWLPAGHMTAATADMTACAACHGADFTGGISGVSCTTCHLGGPASVHPQGWAGAILTSHGPYVVSNGAESCANIYCHGPNLQGVANSGPSCSSCHSWP